MDFITGLMYSTLIVFLQFRKVPEGLFSEYDLKIGSDEYGQLLVRSVVAILLIIWFYHTLVFITYKHCPVQHQINYCDFPFCNKYGRNSYH